MSSRLEREINYSFKSEQLLQVALTHRSHSSPHNERLEFLGDSILDAAIAKVLYERFPQLPEGDLSRLRANLVKQDTLHDLAKGLNLGAFIRLGEGELKSGGAQRPSILADALEAIFGAVWLDGGAECANAVIEFLFRTKLATIDLHRSMKDPKTRLQEFLQSKRLPLPKYILAETSGQAHLQSFLVTCDIPVLSIKSKGVGASRRAAEQSAAENALKELNL